MAKIWSLLILLASPALAAEDPFQSSYDREAALDYQGALDALERTEGQGITGYTASIRRGWLNYLLGSYADATVHYREALAVYPNSVEARQGLMLPLMALRRWTDVQRVADEVLAQAPGDYPARSRKAWAQYNGGRYAEAATTYRSLLGDYPSDVDMACGLGWALLKMGDREGAKRAFQSVLIIAPSHVSANQGMQQLRS